MHIALLTDGKPGHENQSLALAEAMERRTGATVTLSYYEQWKSLANPDLLISAGHSTHKSLLRAKHLFKCPAVVLMKPTVPPFFFDYVVAPKHDYPKGVSDKRVLLTEGMLCRLPERLPVKREQTMFLIGGPSKHFNWESGKTLLQLDTLLSEARGEVIITDSRRTPAEMRKALQEYGDRYFPWEETERGWLPAQLAVSQRAWVSADSMSMIYEALTSGAEVGLLEIPLAGKETRITRSIEGLIQNQRVQSFQNRHESWVLQERFHEAARVAELLLKELT